MAWIMIYKTRGQFSLYRKLVFYGAFDRAITELITGNWCFLVLFLMMCGPCLYVLHQPLTL